jgi:hypothetical protein
LKENRNRRIGRRTTWIASALLLLGMLTGGCGPVWYLDSGYAQRLAKQERRPLLVYFKAWDSTQHRNMKSKIFEDPAIKRELTDTVNLELEFAWAPEEARRWGVQRAQVCVMCTPDGDKVGQSLYVNPVPTEKEFLDWLLKVKATVKPGAAPAVPPPPAPPPPATQPARTSYPEP